jgi:hypothetical protein
MTEGRVIAQPRAPAAAAVSSQQIRRDATFIQKDVIASRAQRLPHPPLAPGDCDIRPTLFVGVYRFFLRVNPRRSMVRHTVLSAHGSNQKRQADSATPLRRFRLHDASYTNLDRGEYLRWKLRAGSVRRAFFASRRTPKCSSRWLFTDEWVDGHGVSRTVSCSSRTAPSYLRLTLSCGHREGLDRVSTRSIGPMACDVGQSVLARRQQPVVEAPSSVRAVFEFRRRYGR